MLTKCFDSVLSQTYPNFELLVIDDGSDEKTAGFLDSYLKDKERTLVVHNPNGGASVARNTGIEKAHGEFMIFVDADDWVEPTFLERLYSSFDDDTDIVMCSRIFEYRKRSEDNHFFNRDICFNAKNKTSLIRKTITTGVGGTWCKLYRRSFLDEHGLRYDVTLRRTQDIIFNLYAFRAARQVRYVDVCLYHYSMQNDSVTKKYNPNAKRNLYLAARAFEKYVDLYYKDVPEIREDLWYKSLNILNEIFKLSIFSAGSDEPLRVKIREARRVCAVPVFKNALDNYSLKDYPSLLGKVRLFLLKNRAYHCLYLLYSVQLYLEHWRYSG